MDDQEIRPGGTPTGVPPLIVPNRDELLLSYLGDPYQPPRSMNLAALALAVAPQAAPQPTPAEDLYRCGEFLFNESDANDYHSRLLRWWKIPRGDFVAYSTCSRKTTLLALETMVSTRADLERLFGRTPPDSATVILLRSRVQYNAFAATTPEEFGVSPESRGYSALHYAFPCDQWIDTQDEDDYPGAACAYWDESTEAGNGWGPFAVRFAAALAFVEAIDQSPEAIASYRADLTQFPSEAFWSEKQIPLWLRFGAASYAERFFIEHGVQNPRWAREWSIAEISASGGLDDVSTILACDLDPKQFERSRRLTLQAGLLVSFLLDGNNPALIAKHQAFKQALGSGQGISAALQALESELQAQAPALSRFAGLELKRAD